VGTFHGERGRKLDLQIRARASCFGGKMVCYVHLKVAVSHTGLPHGISPDKNENRRFLDLVKFLFIFFEPMSHVPFFNVFFSYK